MIVKEKSMIPVSKYRIVVTLSSICLFTAVCAAERKISKEQLPAAAKATANRRPHLGRRQDSAGNISLIYAVPAQ